MNESVWLDLHAPILPSPLLMSFAIPARESGLLDTESEWAFDRLTQLAAKLLGVPVALISLVDSDRQFFKSQHGLPQPWAELRETPLSHSFCQHVVYANEPLTVEDARRHPDFHDNGAVTDIGVTAYAGVPLRDANGRTMGAFCAIDSAPRQWSSDELEILNTLSDQVTAELRVRRQNRRLTDAYSELRQIEQDRRSQTRFAVHDMRTPLNSMVLGVDGLNQLGELNEDQQTCLEIVRRNMQALANIVENLAELAAESDQQHGVLSRDTFPADSSIRAAADQLRSFADHKGITLVERTEERVALYGDRIRLTRVLVNLVGNSIKFTPPGGCVTIMAGSTACDGRPGVRLSVADTGIGMSAGDIAKVFGEGVRGDQTLTPHSTGLGLAFCKQVVEAHGGSIAVDSVPGVGSTFTVWLPSAT